MIVLGPHSSLELWRNYRWVLLDSYASREKDTAEVNDGWSMKSFPDHVEIAHVSKRFGSAADVFIPGSSQRVSRRIPQTYFAKKGFPPGSLVRYSTGIYGLSPEYVIVKLAEVYPEIALISLGIELCSSYIKTEDGTLYHQPAAMSVESLGAFIERVEDVRGLKQTRKILKHLVNHSASPRETALYMLLCLPKRIGGCGFSGATSNLSLQVRTWISKTGVCMSDICWDDKKVCVEYESTEFHGEYSSLQRDSARRIELMHQGYDVITITNLQITNIVLFRTAAEVIARKLGVRLRYDEKFLYRQSELHRLLMTDKRLQ